MRTPTPLERRAHARVAVPILVRMVSGKKEVELVARDISRSGIFLFSRDPPGQVGTVLTLRLSLTAGIKPVEVRAEIVRVVLDPEDKRGLVLGFGAHFVEMTPGKEKDLLNLLDRAMLGRGSMRRIYPRVYHLIEVRARSKTELRAILQDIGEGGVGLTLERSLQIDEEVALEISRAKGEAPLKLQGWVTSCVPAGSSPAAFRVGLRFGRTPAPVRADLQVFLKKLYSK
ncbi:MAG TPA: PilZ domain-containing protein [Myxococcales bacterium]|nr:PilZ domain-containing protein [Myxococcales bacterium]